MNKFINRNNQQNCYQTILTTFLKTPLFYLKVFHKFFKMSYYNTLRILSFFQKTTVWKVENSTSFLNLVYLSRLKWTKIVYGVLVPFFQLFSYFFLTFFSDALPAWSFPLRSSTQKQVRQHYVIKWDSIWQTIRQTRVNDCCRNNEWFTYSFNIDQKKFLKACKTSC